MKQIIKRCDQNPLTLDEANVLASKLQSKGVFILKHRSVYGYTTSVLAEKANMQAILETYENYIFLFAGTENRPFEGYHCLVIAVKDIPQSFEKDFPSFCIVG